MRRVCFIKRFECIPCSVLWANGISVDHYSYFFRLYDPSVNYPGNNTRHCQPICSFRLCCLVLYFNVKVFHRFLYLSLVYESAFLRGSAESWELQRDGDA